MASHPARFTKTQFARLYLFDETSSFRLVHKESDVILQQLREQGLDVGDFASFQGFRGPIKIWEINYPSDIQYYPEYIKTTGEYGELDYLGK